MTWRKPSFSTCNVSEVWFLYLIRDEKMCFKNVQHDSHIPKVVFICAVSCPNPSRDLDSKIGIRQVWTVKEAQRTTARYEEGEGYAVDATIDSEYYGEWYEHEQLQAIKEGKCRAEIGNGNRVAGWRERRSRLT